MGARIRLVFCTTPTCPSFLIVVSFLPYPTLPRSVVERTTRPPTVQPITNYRRPPPKPRSRKFDDTRDESTNSFTEAALSKLLGVSTNSSRRSMDRGATQYSQSGLHSPFQHAFNDAQSEEESADHASAAHYTPEVRSNNYSTSATPTSEYGIYPTSARSGSFPEHIQRQYHPSSNHSGSNGGGMAQPTNPSIAASSPTYPQHNGQYSPYPQQGDMSHGYP